MPEQPPTLRDMIQEALDDGAKYRELEARAIDPVTHRTASRSIFFDTVTGKLDRMPYAHHLRAMAVSLRLPYERVRQAAIQQWVPPEEGATAADIPADSRAQLIADAQRLHDLTGRILAEEDTATPATERGGAA
jgi:hypothetical protein